ncbi:amino acid adenylation domain-containing protein [Nonomuraea sp. NPDC059023]|uniref:non-ribosomal peptide synthetase n=1 Tax=unclassified Nonomuraea TaxID=2593643 RepID=UPI0036A62E70
MKTVTALVEARVAASPDAIAIVDSTGSTSYGELNRRAEAVAARLRAKGAGPGSIVGVRLGRSAAMVTAWLGVLKAGAAYLPLDGSYPEARLRFMLDDSGAELVLSEADVLGIDRPEAPGPDAPAARVEPGDLAYVIYTSGSTGLPKGVMIEHRSIANTLQWYADILGVCPGDRVGQTAASGFDIAGCEIWGALIAGAELRIAPEPARKSPEELCRWAADGRLDVLFMVTPLAQLAIEHGWLDGSSLRVLATGGERLLVAPPEGAGYRFLNMYGPTETAVVATCTEVAPGAELPPPIGTPIANTTAYVLDEDGAPVPDGAEGELYLGGAGVGRGYLGRPELTAERFVVRDGERLYRTGDLVRRLADGNLRFAGRTDDQVKVRGFRIELGEVEAQLRACPGVGEAAVVVWEPERGFPRLAGYACGDFDAARVRALLAERLPEHMVPAVIVPMGRLPLTPNQKLDRAALPDPAEHAAEPRPAAGFDPAQAALAEDWRQACGVTARDADDSLVVLGAGSLDLIMLQARLADRIGLPVPAGLLNLSQPLKEQARLLAGIEPGAAVPVRAARAYEGPGSLGQEAVVFLEELTGSGMGYQYQMILEGPGTPDVSLLEKSLLAVLRNQAALSCRWRITAAGLEGRREEPDTVPLALHRVATEEVEALVARLVDRPFRYDDFPLVGWDLILHPGGTVLLQREHHLIHDGWSVGVFLSQLQAAYDGTEPRESRVSYFDWARDQREWADGDRSAATRAYWHERLKDWRPDSDPPGELRTHLSLQPLGEARSALLESAAARLGVTPYALMLAVFRQVTAESVVGASFANRDVDTQELVGLFVNVLPLVRSRLHGESPADAARAEMALVVAADRHQRLPTPEILRVSAPGARSPLYPIMFSQHDSPLPELSLGAWRPRVRELGNGRGKTDLNVIVMNRGLQHGRSTGRRDASAYALRWEHELTRFPDHVVTELQRRFTRLLDHACAHPDQPWPAAGDNRNGETR